MNGLQGWNDNDLEVMDKRLGTLLTHRHSPVSVSALLLTSETKDEGSAAPDSPFRDHDLPPGWSVPEPSSGWRPSPIGIYIPCKT